ncbi:MAG: hypothetical protein SFV53_05890 [Rickettsiales bacterium]|nr:hypothetical protein [Rickettsiales bacterium]
MNYKLLTFKSINLFICWFVCFMALSCSKQNTNDYDNVDFAPPRQYSPVRPYYPQAPNRYPYSRYYSNPYALPPQNYYQYQDYDQYYIPPLPYQSYEQEYRNPSQNQSGYINGAGGKY